MAINTEKIQARIEAMTASLPKAVESGTGAQFSLLLSLITANQALSGTEAPQASGEFVLDPYAEKLRMDEVYTPDVVERFTGSLQDGERAEFAYLNSHVADAVERPRYQQRAVDHFSLVASMLSEKTSLHAAA